ncbi:MAG: AraC family transcriptional regulator, partial [Pseudomonadota bacterium]
EDFETDIIWLQDAKAALRASATPHDAAGALGVAYEVFRKRFRKLSGMAPGKYRTAVTMEEACRMLSEGPATLKTIATTLGYCDEYHFSKQFRKTIGWSPSEYRARLSSRR